MNNVLISVIIPVYNVEVYLDKCLYSVIHNTYKNLEIICINDGSTDNSLQILKHYYQMDPRIRIVDKMNQGVSSARNEGLKMATGQWIAFVDSDDWIHPQYFEILLKLADKFSADIIIGNHVRKKVEDVEYPDFKHDYIDCIKVDIPMIYRNRNMKSFVWGKLFKKEVISNHLFDEEIAYGEDFLFNAKIYCDADRLNIVHADVALYYYNDREGSAVNTISNTDWLKQGKCYVETAIGANNEVVKRICITEGYKRLLLVRYIEKYTENRKDVISQCNRLLKSNINHVFNNEEASIKEKVVYTLFTWIPQAYRWYRIKEDSTMKSWEKMQRESRKVQKYS